MHDLIRDSAAGNRRKRRLIPLALALFLGACSEQPGNSGQPAKPLEVTTVTVEARDTPVTMEFVGKTASSRRVEIRSRVEGFLEKRLYTEGGVVNVGDILFEIDRKPFAADLQAARAELAQQEARLENAKANLDRVEPLAKRNAVAQKELDDALGTYRSSAAAVEAAQAKVTQAELNLGYCTIRSPVTGISSYAAQREGAYIGYGAGALTYVAQLDPIWVEFSVSENQVLKSRRQVRDGRIIDPEAGNFDVEIVLGDGSVFPRTGRIAFADASLSEETGTFLIRAEIENPPGIVADSGLINPKKMDLQLRPGQFVRVHLKGAIRPGAILVPQVAVQQGAQGNFVWVVRDGKAEFQPVEVGPWHGDQWFIDQGLTAGDTVIIGGALKMAAGKPVQIVEPEPDKQEDGIQPDDKQTGAQKD